MAGGLVDMLRRWLGGGTAENDYSIEPCTVFSCAGGDLLTSRGGDLLKANTCGDLLTSNGGDLLSGQGGDLFSSEECG